MCDFAALAITAVIVSDVRRVLPPRPGARIGGVNRALRVDVPMTGQRLTRWLLFYAAMLLADAAAIVRWW